MTGDRPVRTVAAGCLDGSHPHRFLARRRPLDGDDEPGPDWLVTIWLCPVLRSVGIMVEDLSRDFADLPAPGGPLP